MLLFKKSNTIVKEIHNEFDTAQERLLDEARVIINNTSQFISDKAERLEKAGFVNSESVVKHRKNKEIHVQNKEQAELIEYYKEFYPFQKFLTESELDRICKKYNLIYAPISAYKKNVPESNLSEIEQTRKLDYAHQPQDILKCKLLLHNWLFGGSSFLSFGSKWRRMLPKILDGHFRSTHEADGYLNNIYNTGIIYLVDRLQNIILNKQGLFIAAPKSHFDLKGLDQHGLLHSTFTIIEVKDPIVFRYCKGGIQVISKWGLEGSDEGLVNEKLN